MRKLRNIGYLRFGSKIRQGFAVTTPSLTPPLSLPLSRCRGKQMRGREREAFYTVWGACRPPCRAGGPLPLNGGAAGGGRLPPRASAQINFSYLRISSCRLLPNGRGIKL